MSETTAGTRIKLYAIADGDEGHLIGKDARGNMVLCGTYDDVPEDCDFDGLSGLVVYEATRYGSHAEAIAGCALEEDSYWNPEWAWYDVGSWRPMTATEAVECGMLAASSDAGRDTAIATAARDWFDAYLRTGGHYPWVPVPLTAALVADYDARHPETIDG